MYEELKTIAQQSPSVDFGEFGHGVSDVWILKAEAYLGCSLPPSYKWWLRNYGGGEIGGEEIYSIYEMDFDHAVGGDIVFNAITNKRNGICDFDKLYICRTGVDEYFYFDTTNPGEDGEFPVFVGDHRDEHAELYALNFADFLMKRIHYFS